MSDAIFVAPHPDDETLGAGGTILRYLKEKKKTHWLMMTAAKEAYGFSKEKEQERSEEIETVAKAYGFASKKSLDFAPAGLDAIALSDVIGGVSNYINEVRPSEIFLPFPGDAHSDHKVTFDAVMACTKSFRYPFIKRIYLYETISETDQNFSPLAPAFRPNSFINISDTLEQKISIMKHYASELGAHPFPRNEKVIESLATLRGSQCGCHAAESFMLIKNIID